MCLDPFSFLTWPSYADPVTKDMRLFLVWDSEGISEKTDTIIEDLFEACDGDSDDDSRVKNKSKKRTKKRSSSGSDDDAEMESSEEESNSDDEAW